MRLSRNKVSNILEDFPLKLDSNQCEFWSKAQIELWFKIENQKLYFHNKLWENQETGSETKLLTVMMMISSVLLKWIIFQVNKFNEKQLAIHCVNGHRKNLQNYLSRLLLRKPQLQKSVSSKYSCQHYSFNVFTVV